MRFRFPLSLALAAAISSAAGAQAQQADPVARIAAYDDAVIAVMKQKLGATVRAERFEAITREYYDMPAIAALVVGAKFASASAADRSAVIAALTRHSAVQLAGNFVRYGGERFLVDPTAVTRDTSRYVRVTIASTASSDTLLYRLRESGGGWKIIDVISGGVSQLAVQRNDAAVAVAQGGAAGLAQRLAKLDAAAIPRR